MAVQLVGGWSPWRRENSMAALQSSMGDLQGIKLRLTLGSRNVTSQSISKNRKQILKVYWTPKCSVALTAGGKALKRCAQVHR